MKWLLLIGVFFLAPCASDSAEPRAEVRGLRFAFPEAHAQQRRPVAARRTALAKPAQADAATLRVLRLGLASSDYGARILATEALAHVPGAAAVPLLERQLGDPESDVRAAALESLHLHTHPRARLLLRSVRDDSAELLTLRVLAAWALVSPPSCQRTL